MLATGTCTLCFTRTIAGKGELCLLLVHVHYALLENIAGKGENDSY